MMNKNELIKECLFFSELDRTTIAEIAEICTIRKFEKGYILFSEGDDALAMYILAEGRIDLVKTSPEGKEVLVRGVKKGDMFAEAAMFSGAMYPVTAITKVESTVMLFERRKLLALVRSHPEVSFKMLGVMSKLLRHLNELLAELSLGTVRGRISAYLLKRVEKEGMTFNIGIPKRELAFKLGTIPETLSRNFAKMAREGIIKIKADKITVKDVDKLDAFS